MMMKNLKEDMENDLNRRNQGKLQILPTVKSSLYNMRNKSLILKEINKIQEILRLLSKKKIKRKYNISLIKILISLMNKSMKYLMTQKSN